jgi:hypothetical protein
VPTPRDRRRVLRTAHRCLAACAGLWLAGCVGTRATVLDSASRPAVPEREVRIVLRIERLPEDCSRIAVLRSLGDADFSSESQMIRSLRRRAGRLGANTVLLEYVRNPTTRQEIAALVLGTPNARKGRAVAFHCPAGADEAPEPAPQPPRPADDSPGAPGP